MSDIVYPFLCLPTILVHVHDDIKVYTDPQRCIQCLLIQRHTVEPSIGVENQLFCVLLFGTKILVPMHVYYTPNDQQTMLVKLIIVIECHVTVM